MGEALKEFFFEAPTQKEEKEKLITGILYHIEEINDFFHSDYVIQTRKQGFGFHRPEQFEALRKIMDLKRKVSTFLEKDVEVVGNNHLDHILGNSITTISGGFAKRFREGKYFSEDGQEKLFPVEKFEMVKEGMELMIYYIGELGKDNQLVIEEMESKNGHLNRFVEYLACDLPTQTPDQLKLFQFFRELEAGRITRENLYTLTGKIEKYLDMEKVEKRIA